MKQKIISAIIVATVVFSFIGCGATPVLPFVGFSSPEEVIEEATQAIIDGKCEKLINYMSPKLINATAKDTGSSEKDVRADFVSKYEKSYSNYVKWLCENCQNPENASYEIKVTPYEDFYDYSSLLKVYNISSAGADTVSLCPSFVTVDGESCYSFVFL